jgi:uncharacterized damage-inducible protein DinB
MPDASANTRRPSSDEYFEYYQTYIGKVPDGDIQQMASQQLQDMPRALANVSEQDAVTVQAPYTWTLKQVVGHIIDAERIFADRLHRIACGDTQPQPGMDQNAYVAASDYESPSLSDLVEEWRLCRGANLLLLKRLLPESWNNRGTASGYTVTVRALAWMLVGHVIHHMNIVEKRMADLNN